MQKVDENYRLLNPDANIRKVPKAWGVTRIEEYVDYVRAEGAPRTYGIPAEDLDYFLVTSEEDLLLRKAWRNYAGLPPMSISERSLRHSHR